MTRVVLVLLRWLSRRRSTATTLLLWVLVVITVTTLSFLGAFFSDYYEIQEEIADAGPPGIRSLNCPLAVRNNVGIYKNATTITETTDDSSLANVMLLTAANYEYRDILQNWEHLASRHQLQWAVLAMDKRLYTKLGSQRAVPSSRKFQVRKAGRFRQAGFNILTNNKLRMVLEIVEKCRVDIVFSDVDNVFLQDPFQHDLGKLIRSRRYDYIYSTNDKGPYPTSPRQHTCLTKGMPVLEGNTGFYYMSHESNTLKSIFQEALEQSTQQQDLDDQTLFWNALWTAKNRTEQEVIHANTAVWHHCNVSEGTSLFEKDMFSSPSSTRSSSNMMSMCCLDDFYYAHGGLKQRPTTTTWEKQHSMVTFHANYCLKKNQKIEKLQTVEGAWTL